MLMFVTRFKNYVPKVERQVTFNVIKTLDNIFSNVFFLTGKKHEMII